MREMEKECTGCSQIKKIEEFGWNYDNRSNKKYRRSHCKTCRNRIKQLRKYGLKEAGYKQLYEDQGGRCKICKQVHLHLVIDHDHITNQVRGLLCDSCNKGLGFFRDNIDSLLSAVNYLKWSI